MLGSLSEAEDAVQEAWLRLSRTDVSGVENLRGWMTTVVARVCLDMLRSRRSRRELFGLSEPDRDAGVDPETELALADSVGLALLVVLDTLPPAERIAFVLHDLFDLPFEDIAPILERSEAAARQLASRARRRVRGAPAERVVGEAHPDADQRRAIEERQREVVEAYLAAARRGDFQALLTVLDPNVVIRSDTARFAQPAMSAERLAKQAIQTRARWARAALVDGRVAILVAPHGRLQLVLVPTIREGKMVEIELIARPERLRRLELAVLE
jgi:RNA polymerase sigma-70 factor (ECF subfamily)